jgi:hypothetical protein
VAASRSTTNSNPSPEMSVMYLLMLSVCRFVDLQLGSPVKIEKMWMGGRENNNPPRAISRLSS